MQMGNIEIADAILFDKNDDNVLYLMHNKDSFSGIGARDLTNQILSSSEYLNMHLITSDAESFLGEYYDKIASKAMAEKRQINIEKTEFVKRFRNAKICYIAGYLKQFSSGSNSTYAKYLSIELKRKLETRNFKLVIMGLD